MPGAFDLTELKAYLTRLAQARGFLVDVQLSDDDDDDDEIELPGSKGVPHVKVSVRNPSKVSLEPVLIEVSVRKFKLEGVHAFDVHMADAFRALSAH
jgi:hypothetical protein